MLEFDLTDRLPHERGNLLDLLGIHPDITGRPRAAVSALRALETQAVTVPFLIAHGAIVWSCVAFRQQADGQCDA